MIKIQFQISGFHRGIVKVLVLLGRCGAWVGNWLFTDVSGQHNCPIFKGQAVKEDCLNLECGFDMFTRNVGNQLTIKSPEERSTQTPICRRQCCFPLLPTVTLTRKATISRTKNGYYYADSSASVSCVRKELTHNRTPGQRSCYNDWATGWKIPGFESWQEPGIFIFSQTSRPVLGFIQPPLQGVLWPFPVVKRPGREVDQ
jgi:hypothetical protein